MRILLAIDDSRSSDAAIRAIIGQFRPDIAEVKVLHAVDWPRDLPVFASFAEGPRAGSDLLALRQEAISEADALVARSVQLLQSAGFHAEGLVREGDPRETILDCAEKWPADLIMVGSHGRRGLDRLLLGSVSESVTRHAPCSVEVVRVPAAA